MGGINFGWLAVWGLSPDWLKHKGYATIIRRLDEAGVLLKWVPGGLHIYPSICLKLRKITEILSQGDRKALG
jgi:hypothetical protein